jgi:uncharacterized protein DUF5753
MRAQVRHLLDVSKEPKVTIQLVPFAPKRGFAVTGMLEP